MKKKFKNIKNSSLLEQINFLCIISFYFILFWVNLKNKNKSSLYLNERWLYGSDLDL